MERQIKTKGIVLHEMPIGEFDKRLILLTKELGKVVVFVRGARKSRSKMLACAQTFAYGDFILYKGKNSYTVSSSELIEYFHKLRLDIVDMTYGMYLLEFVDHVAHEGIENQELMFLLLFALKVMNQKHMETKLVVKIFELKAMSLLGFTPWVNDCIECHKEDVNYFSPTLGGLICDKKLHHNDDGIKLHESTIYAIRYILSKPIKEVFSFELEAQSMVELETLLKRFIEYNINKKFKTLEFLKII